MRKTFVGLAGAMLLLLSSLPTSTVGWAAEKNYTPVPVFKVAAACVKCKTRCAQCGASQACYNLCGPSNPLVPAGASCGAYFGNC